MSLHCLVEIGCTGVFEMNVFISYLIYVKCRGWSDEVLKVLSGDASSSFSFAVVGVGSGGNSLFCPILRQLPVIPLECATCTAVGFHPWYWSCTPYPTPLFSITSFYSEQSRISNYPELLDISKLI